MKITIIPYSDGTGWKVWADNDENNCQYAGTIDEGIGKLIMANQRLFNVVIERIPN